MLPPTVNCGGVSELRKQLEQDEFIKLLSETTIFRNIPPSTLPLTILEEICQAANIIRLERNHTLPVAVDDVSKAFIYEILSGYVKIYDRPISKTEKIRGVIKNPPALLAWRVPKELLGDFRFAFSQEKLEDYFEATDECHLLRLPASLVTRLAQTYPQLYFNISSNLASKAIKARIRAQILRLPNIQSKVAELFIELLEERKLDPEITDKKVVSGTFHIEDIAAFLGYGDHSTQGGIRRLINAGLIDHYQTRKSGRFEICDEQGLHRFVGRELAKAVRQMKESSAS
jgi:CRP-like cAMP-binding protein